METIVEQIHREFNEAHDKILVHVPNASAETLYNLGFQKSKSALAYEEDYPYYLRQAEYFRSKYPQYKFITEKQVGIICKKYGLILAPSYSYIGEVPHSKVAEIAAFRCRRIDLKARRINGWGSISHDDCFFGECDMSQAVQGLDFWICAPAKDIDTEGLTLVGHTLIQVDDPVVLHPVEGGFLIVAAWGPEASDESVVNEKMN